MRDGALVYIHSLGSFRFGGRGGMFFLRISHKVPREFFLFRHRQCSVFNLYMFEKFSVFFLEGVFKGVLLGKSNIKHTKNVLFIWPAPDVFSCQAIRLIEQRSNGSRMLLLLLRLLLH